MIDREVWALRLVWLITPFTVGRAIGDVLSDAERPFQLGVSIACWAVWAAILVVLMVPRAITLTIVRLVVPVTVPAALWAVLAHDDRSAAVVVTALTTAVAATGLALRAPVADVFVDGSSYGDETRFLLGTPGPLLAGPLFVVWGLIVVGTTAGPMLLLDRRWVVGGLALVVGLPVAAVLLPAVHRLSNRWLVFVPAGVVVHDKTALRQPQLFRVADVARLGPAPADTEVEDLSLGSIGLALRAELTEPSKVERNRRRAPAELTEISGFVVSPNRPGAVLAEARRRSFTLG